MRIYFFSILYRSVKSQGEFMIQNQYFPEIIDTPINCMKTINLSEKWFRSNKNMIRVVTRSLTWLI